MLSITKSDRVRLSSPLVTCGAGRLCPRLVKGPFDKLGVVLDKPSPSDRVLENNGVKVLLIGPEFANSVRNVEISAKPDFGWELELELVNI